MTKTIRMTIYNDLKEAKGSHLHAVSHAIITNNLKSKGDGLGDRTHFIRRQKLGIRKFSLKKTKTGGLFFLKNLRPFNLNSFCRQKTQNLPHL